MSSFHTPDSATDPVSDPLVAEPTRHRRAASRSRLRRRLVPVAAVVAVAIVGAVVGQRLMTPHLYSGTVLQAPEPAPDTSGLMRGDGTGFDASAAVGEVTVMFFGYTHCPDVCPTTLSVLRRAMERLGEAADRVNVVFVSIDPARDDPATADAYAQAFDPRFAGVSGRPDDVYRVASLFGVYSANGEVDDRGGYTVDHTATLMGIDTSGHLRVVWPPEVTAEQLAADIDALLS